MYWLNVVTIARKDLTVMMTRRSLRIALVVLPLGLALLFSQIIARGNFPVGGFFTPACFVRFGSKRRQLGRKRFTPDVERFTADCAMCRARHEQCTGHAGLLASDRVRRTTWKRGHCGQVTLHLSRTRLASMALRGKKECRMPIAGADHAH